jgi:uncharacterized membrane protein
MNALTYSRTFFTLSMLAFGLINFAFDNYITTKPDTESSIPFTLFGFIFYMLVSTCAIAMMALEKPRVPAAWLSAALFLWAGIRHVPVLILNVNDPAEWNSTAMAIAMAGAALLWATSLVEADAKNQMVSQGRSSLTLAMIGRLSYGIPMCIFGTQHFLYADFIASLIPPWVPAGLFCTYGTGVALIAAGCLITLRIKTRWTAGLLGTMFASWLFIIHLPRIVSDPTNTYEWTSLLQASMCASGAFILSRTSISHAASGISSTDKFTKPLVKEIVSRTKKGNVNRIPQPFASNHRRDIKV